VLGKDVLRDHLMVKSWELQMMGGANGVVLFVLSLCSFKYFKKDQFVRLLLILFVLMMLAVTFVEGELWWGELALIPSVCLAGLLLNGISKRYSLAQYFVWTLFLLLTCSAFIAVHDFKDNAPPRRLASFVDYSTDAIEYALKRGALDTALEETQKMLAICPNEVRGYYYFGEIYWRQKEYLKAFHYWKMGLVIEPNYPLIKKRLALHRNKIISHADGMDSLLLNASTLNTLGNIYFYGGLHEKAEYYFKKSLDINPENVWVYLDLGRMYMAQEAYDKAQDYLEAGIKLNADNFLYTYYLGYCYFQQKHYEKARLMYEKTIVFNPDYGRGYFAQGKVYSAMGKTQEAEVMEQEARGTFHNAVMGSFHLMRADEG